MRSWISRGRRPRLLWFNGKCFDGFLFSSEYDDKPLQSGCKRVREVDRNASGSDSWMGSAHRHSCPDSHNHSSAQKHLVPKYRWECSTVEKYDQACGNLSRSSTASHLPCNSLTSFSRLHQFSMSSFTVFGECGEGNRAWLSRNVCRILMQRSWMMRKFPYLTGVSLKPSSVIGSTQLGALSFQFSSRLHIPRVETNMPASGETLVPEKHEKLLSSCQSTKLVKTVRTRRTHVCEVEPEFGNDRSTTYYPV